MNHHLKIVRPRVHPSYLEQKALRRMKSQSLHSNVQNPSISLRTKHGVQKAHISNMQSSSNLLPRKALKKEKVQKMTLQINAKVPTQVSSPKDDVKVEQGLKKSNSNKLAKRRCQGRAKLERSQTQLSLPQDNVKIWAKLGKSLNTNKASSSKDKVTKVEYAKAKAFHISSKWTSEVVPNHQSPCKGTAKQLAKQVSHAMPRLRSTIHTQKRVDNVKPPKRPRSNITSRALKSEDNSSPQCVKDVHKKERGKLPKYTKAKTTPTNVWVYPL